MQDKELIQTKIQNNRPIIQITGGSPTVNITIQSKGITAKASCQTHDKADLITVEPDSTRSAQTITPATGANDIIAELMPIFYGNEENIRSFINDILYLAPADICRKVRCMVKANVISDLSYRTTLWEVLYNHRLYPFSRRNWTKQVKM